MAGGQWWWWGGKGPDGGIWGFYSRGFLAVFPGALGLSADGSLALQGPGWHKGGGAVPQGSSAASVVRDFQRGFHMHNSLTISPIMPRGGGEPLGFWSRAVTP